MVLSKAKKILSLVAMLSFVGILSALEVPALKGRVNDYANIINSRDEAQITSYLDSLENTTGIQIAVLTIPSLKGEDIASYGIKVCEKWQLGQGGKDNGALLLVAYNEHQVRIEVGYGLEDRLTDAKSGLIIRNVIIPEFKNGNFSEGIYRGVQNMGGIASGNVQLVNRSVQNDNDTLNDSSEGIIFMIIWIIFIFIVLTSKGGIFKWIFLNSLFNSHSYHGSHRGGYHGGGFGGGFGGSSFHGGGGHFGGGGASGHW